MVPLTKVALMQYFIKWDRSIVKKAAEICNTEEKWLIMNIIVIYDCLGGLF
jgi:hypothetical protein